MFCRSQRSVRFTMCSRVRRTRASSVNRMRSKYSDVSASDTFTVRSVFVIDPHKTVRLTLTYPASTGRNFDEILRVIDSLQLTDKHKVATPVNWKQGDDVIIVPAVSNDDAKKLVPGGWKELKPYLRVVPQPR